MKVLKFNAIWCSACLVMKKIFKHVENMHPELEFITYDYDNDEDMVEKYNIGTTIPVLIFVDEKLSIRKKRIEIVKLNIDFYEKN